MRHTSFINIFCAEKNSPLRKRFLEEFKELPALRELAKRRRPSRLTHEMIVASGRRSESGNLSKEELQQETHWGVCLFVILLKYFRMDKQVIHDSMHEIANMITNIIHLFQCAGSQNFTAKRRKIEQLFGRFTTVRSRTMPFFGVSDEQQDMLDELLRSLRLPSAWERIKYLFKKHHRYDHDE